MYILFAFLAVVVLIGVAALFTDSIRSLWGIVASFAVALLAVAPVALAWHFLSDTPIASARYTVLRPVAESKDPPSQDSPLLTRIESWKGELEDRLDHLSANFDMLLAQSKLFAVALRENELRQGEIERAQQSSQELLASIRDKQDELADKQEGLEQSVAQIAATAVPLRFDASPQPAYNLRSIDESLTGSSVVRDANGWQPCRTQVAYVSPSTQPQTVTCSKPVVVTEYFAPVPPTAIIFEPMPSCYSY